ncbi:hypothetical protein [Pseudorhodoferax sp. Leaf265]|jgi:hypothetical protein|uniref:hypothetical protein n=1 Tax=Pseudorhodoferax sp. Leaf265 TaxID=1736315 RepID=UPI0007000FB8|nr:hypothetical protein [Pseudorhodoferax sp. Leaf265]KQP21204.1 hypothetical protein ASF45_03185 [Pseudorhodoferax sp. Leaf265]PZP95793.1 MAG: hypothetical protein DI583_21825 [Variovorax paradoxus]PZQ06747.1 MAG: hypothetical protein DI587_21825 [Variovorax paradoxus]
MDSTSGFGELSDIDRSELQMAYGACVADIELFTRQQWWAGAYALVIYALLLAGVHQLVDPITEGGVRHWVLVVITWTICLYGLLAIKRMQISIVVGRRRLDRVRAHFGRAFQEIWSIARPREDIHRMLYGVMVLGAVLVTWMALDKAYAVALPLPGSTPLS